MNPSEDDITYRYFDERDPDEVEQRSLLKPRSLAIAASSFAITSGLLALWLAHFTEVPQLVGVALAVAGVAACITSRRTDSNVRVLPSVGLTLNLLAFWLLLANLLLGSLLGAEV